MKRGSLPMVEGCWRAVGVEGDRSCAELARVVHCRNCERFSVEAARLFERAPPPGYVDEISEARRGDAAAEGEATQAAVVFRVCDEWLGLPTSAAAFVASDVAVRRLSGRSNRVFAGLCLFLGELTLAVSLRGLLGLGAPRTRGVCWVAMGEAAERWVFDVDELVGVVRYGAGDRTGVPTEPRSGVVSYLSGVVKAGGRTVGLLDERALDAAFSRALQP